MAGVSPERTLTPMSGAATPSRVAAWPMPTSGARRLRSTSTASAFIGETYRTRHRFTRSSGTGSLAIRSMAQRNAERVLPDPVGATTTQWCPELIASHAPAWAVVGALKLLRNHSAVAGEKRSSTSARRSSGLSFAIRASLPSRTDTAGPPRTSGYPIRIPWSRAATVRNGHTGSSGAR